MQVWRMATAFLTTCSLPVACIPARRCSAKGEFCWSDPALQLAALQHRAARLAVQAAEALRRAGGGKVLFAGPTWNSSTVDSIRAAKAHGQYFLVKTFVDSINEAEQQGRLAGHAVAVLRQLASLFALVQLEAAAGDLLEAGYLAAKQASELRAAQRAHLLLLRPNAVALVDAFGFTDYELNSALGRYDGDVYRSLLDMAQGSPLNESEEGPAWEQVLKPVMQRAKSKL